MVYVPEERTVEILLASLPLLLLHGWPDSFYRYHKIIPMLTDRWLEQILERAHDTIVGTLRRAIAFTLMRRSVGFGLGCSTSAMTTPFATSRDFFFSTPLEMLRVAGEATVDAAGNIYAAAGSPARVYRITPQGQSTTIFEPQELQVQALAVDKNGVLYAATNPDGKVYRIERVANISVSRTPAGSVPPNKGKAEDEKDKSASEFSASVFFDPRTKYIWDLVFDNAGNLYVATGDHGEIFRITPKGEHSVFFKSDEAHIRALTVDAKGNLIAGSDGSGLVYQIKPDGQGFVLYSAPKKEITALAIDKAGNIYAAAGGEKRPPRRGRLDPDPLSQQGLWPVRAGGPLSHRPGRRGDAAA